MQILNSTPPNIKKILKVFPKALRPGVIFAYGGNIYNPSGVDIPDALIEHERVHLYRQSHFTGGSEAWWDRYLSDVKFRYVEELWAHREEYAHMMEGNPNRQTRRRALAEIAKRLASPLYGNLVTMAEAKKAIANI